MSKNKEKYSKNAFFLIFFKIKLVAINKKMYLCGLKDIFI